MTQFWRKCRAYMATYYALMMAYRGEIFMWMIATSLPLIMMGVWVKASESGHFPMDAVAVARYFIAVFFMRQITICWVIHEFEFQVVSGKLSPLLLQPADPSWRYVMMHAGEQATRLPLVLLSLGFCFFLAPQALWGDGTTGAWVPHPIAIAFAVLAGYSAFVFRYLLQYTIAMLAFWIERASSVEHFVYLPYLFLSGMLFPIDVLLAHDVAAIRTVGEIAMWTPFPYMLWFPAKLLTLTWGEPIAWDMLGRGFAIIYGWSVVFWFINRWVWRRGLRHYSAMGA